MVYVLHCALNYLTCDCDLHRSAHTQAFQGVLSQPSANLSWLKMFRFWDKTLTAISCSCFGRNPLCPHCCPAAFLMKSGKEVCNVVTRVAKMPPEPIFFKNVFNSPPFYKLNKKQTYLFRRTASTLSSAHSHQQEKFRFTSHAVEKRICHRCKVWGYERVRRCWFDQALEEYDERKQMHIHCQINGNKKWHFFYLKTFWECIEAICPSMFFFDSWK